MASTQLICRIRVNKANDCNGSTEQLEHSAVFDIKDCAEMGIQLRTQWAREVVNHFGVIHNAIQPWDFLARLDGSVKLLPVPASEGEVYSARFQISPGTLRELDHHEKVKRVERFAMASLLYEILSGTKPFEKLTDDEVQHRFSNAVFSDDASFLSHFLIIYSGWSQEFSQELNKRDMSWRLVEARVIYIFSSSTKYQHFTINYKLRQSTPSPHWHSSNWFYSFCCIIFGGVCTWCRWVHCSETGNRLCCCSLASVDWSRWSWQSLCLVSECSNGRNGREWYSSCGCCWCGIDQSGECSETNRYIQESLPYGKKMTQI